MTDTQYGDASALVRDGLAGDGDAAFLFQNILGALFLCGWSYSLEASSPADGQPTAQLTGYRVDRNGEEIKRDHVVVVMRKFGNEWELVADETGRVRNLKSGDVKLTRRDAYQLHDFILKNTNEWEFVDSLDLEDQEVEDEVIDDGYVGEDDVVEDEVSEEPAEADTEQLQLEA